MRSTIIFLLLLTRCWNLLQGEDISKVKPEFTVTGYLPAYRVQDNLPDNLEYLTDLMIFSGQPAADGTLNTSQLKKIPWEKLKTYKTQHRMRCWLCLGGYNNSAHFAAVAEQKELREKFCQHLLKYCLENRLEGVDLDWEHPKNQAEVESYGKLLAEIKSVFKPQGLMLSVTMAGWQQLTREAIDNVDRVQLMSYDHEGRHATFEKMESDIKTLLAKGVPAEKLIVGLPFYGRDIKDHNQALSYREILAKFPELIDQDEAGGVYFNGPKTIRSKTSHIFNSGFAGVMVWEIGQDALNDQSLLKVIHEEIMQLEQK